jgi:hypothetical protein
MLGLLVLLDLFGRVGPEQVVEAEPVGHLLLDQVRLGQSGQRRGDLANPGTGQAGRRAHRDVRAGMQPEQPEQAGRLGPQGAVGPGEHRAYVGGPVPVVERVQAAARLGQRVGQHGEGEAGPGGGAGGHDGQGQRKPGAGGNDLVDGSGLAGDPVRPEPPGQQPAGVGAGEWVQDDRPGAVGDQPGQFVAAGHDDQAAGRAGQQRPDVVGVAGVVQHHQDPPPGQQAAVERGLRLGTHRDHLGGHAEGVQESADHVRPLPGRVAGVEAAQVDVELAVREVVADLVCPVQGQRALADAGHAGQRDDRRGRRRIGRAGPRQLA